MRSRIPHTSGFGWLRSRLRPPSLTRIVSRKIAKGPPPQADRCPLVSYEPPAGSGSMMVNHGATILTDCGWSSLGPISTAKSIKLSLLNGYGVCPECTKLFFFSEIHFQLTLLTSLLEYNIIRCRVDWSKKKSVARLNVRTQQVLCMFKCSIAERDSTLTTDGVV